MRPQIITVLYYIAAIYLIAGSSVRVGIMLTRGQDVDALPIIGFLLGWALIIVHSFPVKDERP